MVEVVGAFGGRDGVYEMADGGPEGILGAAYRHAPAALVAPFQYSQMIWAILLGFLVWGDLPEPAKLLGAAIVAASGLFILHREAALGRRPTASLHPNAGSTQTG